MNKIIVDTSNIINWKLLKSNPNTTTSEEIVKCSIQVIKCNIKSGKLDFNKPHKDLEISCNLHKDKILVDERQNLRINAKLFLQNYEVSEVEEAVKQLFKHLEVDEIETLILSIPYDENRTPIPLSNFCRLYKVLETYVNNNQILRLGVCDFSFEDLRDLCQEVQVQPYVNHIYTQRMCSISPDLKEFANDHHIQLLIHNDQSEIFPAESFKQDMNSVLAAYPSVTMETVRARWVCRYSIVYRERGVIRTRGYISCINWQ